MTKSMENTLNSKGLVVQKFKKHSASLLQTDKKYTVFKYLSNLILGYHL
jgi:hypothetical protein